MDGDMCPLANSATLFGRDCDSVESQFLNIRSLSSDVTTPSVLYVWCTYIDAAAWTYTRVIFLPAVFFPKGFRLSAERMDHIFYHLPHFASPNNDAIGSASKFQIFTINE